MKGSFNKIKVQQVWANCKECKIQIINFSIKITKIQMLINN